MNKSFTPYFFQYSYFAGREQSSLSSSDLTFEYEDWLSIKIRRLIENAPELPDEIINTILKKANVS